jgi:23S rRNA (cytidine1920-2'-O)/16S rRNA (cytidine1409-2'-O)-methyltransferase
VGRLPNKLSAFPFSLVKHRVRLDTLVVDRGLAASRDRARALILAGQVRVNGQPVTKAGAPVDPSAELSLLAADHPYVSRGGLKLAHALASFRVPVAGRVALDIGASTGGFTDALLQAGAARVVALDVGHGQIDWKLRSDPRVIVLERVNARALTADQLPPATRVFDIVTIDVSFISLRHILPVVPATLAAVADVVALVKPQFEAGRDDVGDGGLVLDPVIHERVVDEVKGAARAVGLNPVAMTPSPITGATGNQEFLLHLRSAS